MNVKPIEEIAKIWDERSVTLLPMRFAAVIIHYSKDGKWEAKDWEKEARRLIKEQWIDTQIIYVDDGQCICSHHIHDGYVVKNVLNNTFLTTGCDCILKFAYDEMFNSIELTRNQLTKLKSLPSKKYISIPPAQWLHDE